MSTILKCKVCGLFVSQWLQELTDYSQLNMVDQQPLLPNGFFLLANHLRVTEPTHPFSQLHFQDSVALNLADLQNTRDNDNWVGCCGPSGSELNRTCTAGHLLGRDMADCCSPHFTFLDLDKVRFLEKN